MSKRPTTTEETKTVSWYVAVSFQRWGRGKSVDEAMKNLKKSGGDSKTYLVYRFDIPEGSDPPYVDESGCTVSPEGCERKTVIAVKNGKPVDPER